MGRLEEKVAVVTGTSRGIGRATTPRFVQEGARVCLSDMDGDGAKTAAEELDEEGFRVFPARPDVTDPSEVEVVERCGPLDILANNAGVTRDALVLR